MDPALALETPLLGYFDCVSIADAMKLARQRGCPEVETAAGQARWAVLRKVHQQAPGSGNISTAVPN